MAISNRQQLALFAELHRIHDPVIRRAFLEAIRDARASVNLATVIAALSRGDIASAMQEIEFSRTFLAPLDMAIRGEYFEGGKSFLDQLVADGKRSGTTVTVRFDPGNPRAAEWLLDHSSKLITNIVDDQRITTQEALAAGMNAGRHPRTVALDVVGRINKLTKRREGGVIGLTSPQGRWVENARRELQSGDPAQMRAYLERKARDRRFDSMVRKAIKEERPVPATSVTAITTRYSDKLLKLRGDTIARTESLTALSHSQDEAARQLLEASGLRADQIVRTWVAHLDRRTRDGHIALHEKRAPLDGAFVSPVTGKRLRFPRDTSLGASGVDVIQCRCTPTLKVMWKGSLDPSRFWRKL
jgi:hypothetical protein